MAGGPGDPACLATKSHSYGEYVFDWAWADAWRRMGLQYYPKLLTAIPFTPATGPRLLHDPKLEAAALWKLLAEQMPRWHERLGISSWHVLFPEEDDAAAARRGRPAHAPPGAVPLVQSRLRQTSTTFSTALPAASARRCAGNGGAWPSRAWPWHARRPRAQRPGLGSLPPLLPDDLRQAQRPRRLPDPRVFHRGAPRMGEQVLHGRRGNGRRAGGRGPVLSRQPTRSTGATGAAAASTTACTSRPATTRASSTASARDCSASTPAPRASTRSSAASSRPPPCPATGSRSRSWRRGRWHGACCAFWNWMARMPNTPRSPDRC
jgi:hypothetical protein